MKKVLIATAIASTLFASHAFAQTSNFSGFSGALNLNVSSSSTELSGSGASFKLGENSQSVGLQVAYGFPTDSNFVFSVGGTYDLSDLTLAKLVSGSSNITIKGTNNYAIYLEPGYALSPSTLAYGKLAYLSMKAEVSGSGTSGNQDFNGVGYGFGIRSMLTKNVFLQAEFMQSDYEKVSNSGLSIKPTATTGTVGIGYKF
jgi:opacity protein-like surface antigen